jgi:hypothetical protein
MAEPATNEWLPNCESWVLTQKLSDLLPWAVRTRHNHLCFIYSWQAL